MKQIQLASAIALVTGLAISSVASAMTTGGTITFTGVVTDATCTVRGGSGTDGGEGNFTVALEPVAATALSTAGATANIKDFQVILGGPGQGTCEDGKVARMSFLPSSPRIDPATGTLTNALTGEARNTNVQVLDDAHVAIDLRDPANGLDFLEIEDNTAIVDLAAQYYATDAATPGLVSTSVVYSVVYN